MIKRIGRLIRNILTLNRSIHVLNSHKNSILNIENILKNHEYSLVDLTHKQNHLPRWLNATNYSADIKKFFRFFEIVSLPTEILRRVGSLGDGGYLIKIPDWNNLLLISVGVGENCDFENEITADGGICLAFDPTIDFLPTGHSELIVFKKIGLKGNLLKDNSTYKLLSLNDLIETHCMDSIEDKSYRILKLDCEGAEWQSLEEVTDQRISLFDQVIIEFHQIKNITEPNFKHLYLSVAEKLKEFFHIINISPNNNSEVLWAKDLLVTDTFEITFINKKHIDPIDLHIDHEPAKFPNPPFRLVAVNKFFY